MTELFSEIGGDESPSVLSPLVLQVTSHVSLEGQESKNYK
jgi:hypothetical protein